jgi:hypothetical protein
MSHNHLEIFNQWPASKPENPVQFLGERTDDPIQLAIP